MKCVVVERASRMVRDRLYKYFTFKNSNSYTDVMPKFVKVYNDTVHSVRGMVHSQVTDADVLAILRRMKAKRLRVRVTTAKFCVGQHVRIRKEKMKFPKVAEHSFSTEIFRIVKVIHRRPRAVYELEDLNGTQIDGQLYQEELTPVCIISRTNYKIDKILDKRVIRGNREVFVRWQGYIQEFDMWVSTASAKNL